MIETVCSTSVAMQRSRIEWYSVLNDCEEIRNGRTWVKLASNTFDSIPGKVVQVSYLPVAEENTSGTSQEQSEPSIERAEMHWRRRAWRSLKESVRRSRRRALEQRFSMRKAERHSHMRMMTRGCDSLRHNRVAGKKLHIVERRWAAGIAKRYRKAMQLWRRYAVNRLGYAKMMKSSWDLWVRRKTSVALRRWHRRCIERILLRRIRKPPHLSERSTSQLPYSSCSNMAESSQYDDASEQQFEHSPLVVGPAVLNRTTSPHCSPLSDRHIHTFRRQPALDRPLSEYDGTSPPFHIPFDLRIEVPSPMSAEGSSHRHLPASTSSSAVVSLEDRTPTSALTQQRSRTPTEDLETRAGSRSLLESETYQPSSPSPVSQDPTAGELITAGVTGVDMVASLDTVGSPHDGYFTQKGTPTDPQEGVAVPFPVAAAESEMEKNMDRRSRSLSPRHAFVHSDTLVNPCLASGVVARPSHFLLSQDHCLVPPTSLSGAPSTPSEVVQPSQSLFLVSSKSQSLSPHDDDTPAISTSALIDCQEADNLNVAALLSEDTEGSHSPAVRSNSVVSQGEQRACLSTDETGSSFRADEGRMVPLADDQHHLSMPLSPTSEVVSPVCSQQPYEGPVTQDSVNVADEEAISFHLEEEKGRSGCNSSTGGRSASPQHEPSSRSSLSEPLPPGLAGLEPSPLLPPSLSPGLRQSLGAVPKETFSPSSPSAGVSEHKSPIEASSSRTGERPAEKSPVLSEQWRSTKAGSSSKLESSLFIQWSGGSEMNDLSDMSRVSNGDGSGDISSSSPFSAYSASVLHGKETGGDGDSSKPWWLLPLSPKIRETDDPESPPSTRIQSHRLDSSPTTPMAPTAVCFDRVVASPRLREGKADLDMSNHLSGQVFSPVASLDRFILVGDCSPVARRISSSEVSASTSGGSSVGEINEAAPSTPEAKNDELRASTPVADGAVFNIFQDDFQNELLGASLPSPRVSQPRSSGRLRGCLAQWRERVGRRRREHVLLGRVEVWHQHGVQVAAVRLFRHWREMVGLRRRLADILQWRLEAMALLALRLWSVRAKKSTAESSTIELALQSRCRSQMLNSLIVWRSKAKGNEPLSTAIEISTALLDKIRMIAAMRAWRLRVKFLSRLRRLRRRSTMRRVFRRWRVEATSLPISLFGVKLVFRQLKQLLLEKRRKSAAVIFHHHRQIRLAVSCLQVFAEARKIERNSRASAYAQFRGMSLLSCMSAWRARVVLRQERLTVTSMHRRKIALRKIMYRHNRIVKLRSAREASQITAASFHRRFSHKRGVKGLQFAAVAHKANRATLRAARLHHSVRRWHICVLRHRALRSRMSKAGISLLSRRFQQFSALLGRRRRWRLHCQEMHVLTGRHIYHRRLETGFFSFRHALRRWRKQCRMVDGRFTRRAKRFTLRRWRSVTRLLARLHDRKEAAARMRWRRSALALVGGLLDHLVLRAEVRERRTRSQLHCQLIMKRRGCKMWVQLNARAAAIHELMSAAEALRISYIGIAGLHTWHAAAHRSRAIKNFELMAAHHFRHKKVIATLHLLQAAARKLKVSTAENSIATLHWTRYLLSKVFIAWEGVATDLWIERHREEIAAKKRWKTLVLPTFGALVQHARASKIRRLEQSDLIYFT